MRLTSLPRPPLTHWQVRVAVEAAGVNLVDAGNRADPTWAGIRPPYVVGYEFAGRITKAGAAVDGLRTGQAVWGLLPVRGTRWGAYAEEVTTDARFVALRPESLSPEEAACLPLAGATALQLLDRLDPAPGEWMLVPGAAGGVGHMLVQLAHARGVRVAAISSTPRHELLRRLGVDVVVDRYRPDALPAARREVGEDFPIVADLVGNGLLRASLEVTAEGGRAGTIVELAGDLDEAVNRNVTLHGVLVRPGRDALAALGSRVDAAELRPVIDRVLPLTDAPQAHARVETRRGQGKLVLSLAGT